MSNTCIAEFPLFLLLNLVMILSIVALIYKFNKSELPRFSQFEECCLGNTNYQRRLLVGLHLAPLARIEYNRSTKTKYLTSFTGHTPEITNHLWWSLHWSLSCKPSVFFPFSARFLLYLSIFFLRFVCFCWKVRNINDNYLTSMIYT